MGHTLEQLAGLVNGKCIGDGSAKIDSVATLDRAKAGQISFLSNQTYKHQLASTKATAVILQEKFVQDCPVNALVVNNPHACYAIIAQHLHPYYKHNVGIHSSATINPDSRIGENVYIGPNVVIENDVEIGNGVSIGANSVIERGVRIGSDTTVLSNVTICHDVEIAQRVLIHPGVVVGSDGFGQAYDGGKWIKVPQLGGVEIHSDVEIGANTTIDRGAIENTIIGEGVKLDNQIQIAHNVAIGDHTVIAACTGIAGSAKIGKHCMIGGAVGIVGHLDIADNVTITAMSLVTRSIDRPGCYSSGIPADESNKWNKSMARVRQLDALAKRIKNLEKKE